MDHNATYRKTELGLEEIKTRAAGLPVKLRSVLILMDGKTPLSDLLTRSPLPPESYPQLDLLLDGGFITPVETSAPTVDAEAAVTAGQDLRTLQRQACRKLLDLLGPEADRFTIRIEAVNSQEEFLGLAADIREVLRVSRGKRAADKFWQDLGGDLPT
jgi:hypothetical protein